MPPHKVRKVRPPLQTAVENQPHPSFSQGHAYPQTMRELVMWNKTNDEDDNELLLRVQDEYLWLSEKKISRWVKREEQEGHYWHYRKTINKPAIVLQGQDLVFLAYYRVLFPKSNEYEINAFLFNVTGRLYSVDGSIAYYFNTIQGGLSDGL